MQPNNYDMFLLGSLKSYLCKGHRYGEYLSLDRLQARVCFLIDRLKKRSEQTCTANR